jgi:2-dehydropantoate 2-reductase
MSTSIKKILVYGAGPLGSLFAARLAQGGHAVSLLARGQRLADLRQYGVVLEDGQSGVRSVTHVPIVDKLSPEDAYDLVAVIMRKNRVPAILPVLAANHHTPNILFLHNNAAGPGELVAALGKERVLLGFPMSAGMFVEGHVVCCLSGTQKDPSIIPIGEADGSITERARQVAEWLSAMPGCRVEIRADMDSWLKCHVAILFPSIAPATFAADLDRFRLARTRDLVVLVVRAVREGLQVMTALGIPITPPQFKMYQRLPEWLLVPMLRKMARREEIEIALIGHARAARDESQHLAKEFLVLRDQSGVPTPAIDRLLPYLDPATPLMPDGSHKIRLQWW